MLDEDVLDLLPNLVHLFLVVGHQGFGDGMCDSINVTEVSTTLHTDLDVQVSRLLTAFAVPQDLEPAHFGQADFLFAARYSHSCLFSRPLGNKTD